MLRNITMATQPPSHPNNTSKAWIPSKVVRHATYKTMMLLPLIVIHSLHHPQTQAFHHIWLQHSLFQGFRIRWQKLLLSQCGPPSYRRRVPLILSILIQIQGALPLMCVVRLLGFHLFGQHVQCIKAGTHLFPLRELSHHEL